MRKRFREASSFWQIMTVFLATGAASILGLIALWAFAPISNSQKRIAGDAIQALPILLFFGYVISHGLTPGRVKRYWEGVGGDAGKWTEPGAFGGRFRKTPARIKHIFIFYAAVSILFIWTLIYSDIAFLPHVFAAVGVVIGAAMLKQRSFWRFHSNDMNAACAVLAAGCMVLAPMAALVQNEWMYGMAVLAQVAAMGLEMFGRRAKEPHELAD